MKKDTKITKLVLEVGGKKMEFTPEEAKELKGILSDLFGGEKTVYVDRWSGYWPYYTPRIIYTTNAVGSAMTDCGTYSGNTWQGSLTGGAATFTAQSANSLQNSIQ